jgi:hypothetical protein
LYRSTAPGHRLPFQGGDFTPILPAPFGGGAFHKISSNLYLFSHTRNVMARSAATKGHAEGSPEAQSPSWPS